MCVGFKGGKKTLDFSSSFFHGYEKIGVKWIYKNDIVKPISDYNNIYKQSENVIVGFF